MKIFVLFYLVDLTSEFLKCLSEIFYPLMLIGREDRPFRFVSFIFHSSVIARWYWHLAGISVIEGFYDNADR